MNNTCNFENCQLAKKHKIKDKKECFNYVETWWTFSDGKQPKLVDDCSPKRTVLMIQELHNKFIGLQKSNEEFRNAFNGINMTLGLVIKNFENTFEKICTTFNSNPYLINPDNNMKKLLNKE